MLDSSTQREQTGKAKKIPASGSKLIIYIRQLLCLQ